MTFFSPPNRDNIVQKPNMDKARGPNNEASAMWQSWFNRLQRELNYKSYCFVHKNNNNQAITAATETLLTWTTADNDTQSEVDLSNGKWVCKKEGTYLIHCQCKFNVAADQDRCWLRLYSGATVISEVRAGTGSVADSTRQITEAIPLVVDDEITFKVINNDNNDTISGAKELTHFSIYRLGD